MTLQVSVRETGAHRRRPARRRLEASAMVDALADMYWHRCTTLQMLVSSAHPHAAGVQVALVQTLPDFGAAFDGVENDSSSPMTALRFHEKLRRAQDLLRHSIPSGGEGQVFDRALTVLLEQLEQAKYAATSKPRPSRGSRQRSRHIPSAVPAARRVLLQANDRSICRCNLTPSRDPRDVLMTIGGGAADTARVEVETAFAYSVGTLVGRAEGEFGFRESAGKGGNCSVVSVHINAPQS